MLAAPILFACLQLASGSRLRTAESTALALEAHQLSGRAGVEAAVGSMISEIMDGKGPNLHNIMKLAHSKMDFDDAVEQLDGKLPADVASLVTMTAKGRKAHKAAGFDEDSMQKARVILNRMMLEAWGELDDVLFECINFRTRNRGLYDQVEADLARIGSVLARFNEERVAAEDGVSEQDRQRQLLVEEEMSVDMTYKTIRTENERELRVRKNDLDVFDFVLKATECEPGSGGIFMQVPKERKPNVQICQTGHGFTLNFTNTTVQAKVDKLMSSEAKLALQAAFDQVKAPSFIQLEADKFPPYNMGMMPVMATPHPDGQWKKCSQENKNCGVLHDLMSLEWGKFRDSFDELTAEMEENRITYEKRKENLNDQMTLVAEQKGKFMQVWASVVSSINTYTEEGAEKDTQKRDLTEEFLKQCAIFKARISEILHTKICAVRKVRNELLIDSAETPPNQIDDCDFTDWESKNGECYSDSGMLILCDDTCPREDPYLCGGLEVMKREIVVAPNQYGMECPPMERKRKCGQKKCAVECVMSSWGGWSKCTKECEGGIEGRTRSMLVKPKYGGKVCDTETEERNCNTESCDRDCALSEWSDWAPCSMACDGGVTTRNKKVLVPIRGNGKCPTDTSIERLDTKTCNTQACEGDEICIAQQDLIIALDASGSLRQEGFDTLQKFAANITGNYKAEYFGAKAVKIGVVLFGNGALTNVNGSYAISGAINVVELTTDFDAVRTKILEQTWQRGFTNMAQALTLADTMLTRGGRAEAQSAVLVLSDGKYSFKYQTAEKAQELKDKNIMLYMAPVIDVDNEDVEILKEWASQPWETNFERIPGLAALKFNMPFFAEKLLVKFCPNSMSPSLMMEREADTTPPYILIHQYGYPSDECGVWIWEGYTGTIEECLLRAEKNRHTAISFGRSWRAGYCYTEAVKVDQEYWDRYKNDRTNPAVPGDESGCVWLYNPYYDTLAINPAVTAAYMTDSSR